MRWYQFRLRFMVGWDVVAVADLDLWLSGCHQLHLLVVVLVFDFLVQWRLELERSLLFALEVAHRIEEGS